MDKKEIWKKIIEDYSGDIGIYHNFKENYSCAVLEHRIIFISYIYRNKYTIDSIMNLLHEIGHIMTSDKKDAPCLREYKASQWAIDKCKEYGLRPTKKVVQDHQEYIYEHFQNDVSNDVANIPAIDELDLHL